MPVCVKCGWELVYGPRGCACTQAAKRERMFRETSEMAKRLDKLFSMKKGKGKKK